MIEAKLPVDRSTQDALEIWQAGVDAVRADRVVRDSLRWDGKTLEVQGQRIDLSKAQRLIIVGAGKATAGMLEGLLEVIDQGGIASRRIETLGWINVPEGVVPGSLQVSLDRKSLAYCKSGVTICQARPSGVNEPTPRVMAGTQAILEQVEQAGPQDAVIFLLSGGGSALLCAPCEWLSLETKVAITRALSSRGAGIQELNAVRRALSQVKGGGLARRSKAGHLITLVISDVLGDPLEMIGSGPTVLEPAPDSKLAAEILQRFAPGEFSDVVSKLLQIGSTDASDKCVSKVSAQAFVLANNQTAVQAAVVHARELGYQAQGRSEVEAQGSADRVGVEFAQRVLGMPSRSVWISGGEPTVVLADASIRGQGGRNQHLVLSAARAMLVDPKFAEFRRSLDDGRESMALVSGGTDGEDGTTQAAGAWIDGPWLSDQDSRGGISELEDAIRRCDSYRVFERTGNLIQTGPTHTNVCDLRVLLRG